MSLQVLAPINTTQKKVGVKLQTQDINGNPVSLASGRLPNPQIDQQGTMTFANMAPTSDLPANSTFTFDIIGVSVSNGPVNITIQTQLEDGASGFSQVIQQQITQDPNTPGPPAQFVVTDGSIVSQ